MSDSLMKSVRESALAIQSLARRAVQGYSPIVETILNSGCRDRQRIEQILDGLLDFCFDPNVLLIYKKLCRHYYDIDPAAATSYVHAYREMWDSPQEKSEKRATCRYRRPVGETTDRAQGVMGMKPKKRRSP